MQRLFTTQCFIMWHLVFSKKALLISLPPQEDIPERWNIWRFSLHSSKFLHMPLSRVSLNWCQDGPDTLIRKKSPFLHEQSQMTYLKLPFLSNFLVHLPLGLRRMTADLVPYLCHCICSFVPCLYLLCSLPFNLWLVCALFFAPSFSCQIYVSLQYSMFRNKNENK